MSQVCSIFSQLLKLFPRSEFEQAVRQHRGERHARGFTCWGQFVAMLFCQLGRAQSLREICGGLAASEGKLRHLGLSAAPPRSTLAYANRQRPWQIYESFISESVPFMRTPIDLARCLIGPEFAHQGRRQAPSGTRSRRLPAQADAAAAGDGATGIELRAGGGGCAELRGAPCIKFHALAATYWEHCRLPARFCPPGLAGGSNREGNRGKDDLLNH